MRPSIDQVPKALATSYGVEVEALMKVSEGKTMSPGKIGMYLANELCDLTPNFEHQC